jgi:hypothetical protein
MAIADAEAKGFKALRKVAEAHLDKAMEGDMAAIKELGDRLDGKVPQAVVGDADHDAIQVIAEIKRVIVDKPGDSNS